MSLPYRKLLKLVLFLFANWLFFAGLFYARPFLLPLAVAALLAMLFWPVSAQLEKWGSKRTLSSFLSVLLFVLFFAGIALLLSAQIKQFASDWPQLQQSFQEKLSQVQDYIQQKFGIGAQEQQALLDKAQSSGKGSGSMPKQFAMGLYNTLTDFLLVLIYLFLFLLYRKRFRIFILKYADEEKKQETNTVVLKTARVALKYLSGRLMLMAILAVLYSLGLSVLGVKHGIFLGIIAALLSIIPFIGNILGAGLPIALSLMEQGNQAVIGVIILFTFAQLIENYLLEPMVVGKQVDLNPFFTIVIVILGGYIWGIVGMILSIPLLGILKIIFDHIPSTQPLGYLIGEQESGPSLGEKVVGKMKSWLHISNR